MAARRAAAGLLEGTSSSTSTSSAGRYMCGEETGLLNALEGKRATPRNKPPFPQVADSGGGPTVVNNVETLCNLPHILREGADWYKSLSLLARRRHKGLRCERMGQPGRASGSCPWARPRAEMVDLAGGMCDGLKLRGFLPGGASTDFLSADQLDVKMDFDSVAGAG